MSAVVLAATTPVDVSPTAVAALGRLTPAERFAVERHYRKVLRAEVEAASRNARTRRKRNRGTDPEQSAAGIRRMMVSLANDPASLDSLAELHRALELLTAATVDRVRGGVGLAAGNAFTWQEVGDALGLTRQGAQQKFGRRR